MEKIVTDFLGQLKIGLMQLTGLRRIKSLRC